MKLGSSRLTSTLLLAAGAALIITAVGLFVLDASGVIGGAQGQAGPGTVTGFGSVLGATTPDADAPPSPSLPASTSPLDRIVIPSVDVDAPIVVRGLTAEGVMESPDNAYDVAWYDFTAKPGAGSNAVFSGHVDYVDVGPAVFWPLKDLQAGDVIEIRYVDGMLLNYAVTAVNTVDAATAPVDQIVGPTPADSITLITCTGQFNRQTRQYDQRLIVRAVEA